MFTGDEFEQENTRTNQQEYESYQEQRLEVMLMNDLWSRGLRYRKNVNSICGKPDIVFIGKKVAVFCDSEFWHGYNWEERKYDFRSHQDFWFPKIERNIERDKEVNAQLESEGWTV